MKNKLRKEKFLQTISLLTCGLLLATGTFGCKSEEAEAHPVLPDYSNGEQFEFFAYRALTDGYYKVDGETFYAGQDFRTVEKYKEMKDCGFTIAYITTGYAGEKWDTSETKMSMENAYAAGFEKITISDKRINGAIDSGDSLNEKYPDDASLDAFIKDCLTPYIQMPGFYGLTLLDEPNYKKQAAYGRVYKSVRRVAKEEFGIDEIYLHMNFLPCTASESYYDGQDTDADDYDFDKAYTSYLEGFLKETEGNRISVDTYAFHPTIAYGWYPSVQILRELCTKYDADMSYCLQSFNMFNGQNEWFRQIGKSEMYMELYSMVGFGADHFAYYTYMPDVEYNTAGARVINGSNFLTREGEKTNLWYYGQSIMHEVQALAKIITNYEFQGARLFRNEKSVIQFPIAPYFGDAENRITFDNSHEFSLLKAYEIDNDVSLVTELYDEQNDLFMYMAQNVIDPQHSAAAGVKNGQTDMNVSMTFDSAYTWVAEYENGQINYVKLNNGVYEKKLSAGYAVYLIPLK